ncbi:MAG: hypothetical protein M3Q78_12585, partial [Acidobacteriota bacterium]|nr:hypothetical protein [Acidobacteriota bacterium]
MKKNFIGSSILPLQKFWILVAEIKFLLAVCFLYCVMGKDSFSTKMLSKSENASVFGARAHLRSHKVRDVSNQRVAEIIEEVERKLTEGLSSAAEKILTDILKYHSHTVENTAKLYRLLSYTLETQGNYKESLKAIETYDDEELLSRLNLETQISVIWQASSWRKFIRNREIFPNVKADLPRLKKPTRQPIFSCLAIF